jgi:hypothetical protein
MAEPEITVAITIAIAVRITPLRLQGGGTAKPSVGPSDALFQAKAHAKLKNHRL